MTKRLKLGLFLAGTITSLALPAFAVSSDFLPLPQPKHEGNVSYITGGIGNDERQDLQTQKKDYNLLITDSNKKGQYTADNDFTITSRNGRRMINVDDAGPLLYAKLPPGHYKVSATYGDQHKTRDVSISPHRDDHLHMIWH